MNRHDIVHKAKGLVYVVVLLLLFILLLLPANYCSVLLVVPSPQQWMRIASAIVGSILLALNFAAVLLLNKIVPVRVEFVRYGVVLFWLRWGMSLLSLVLAISLAVAAMCGVEFAFSSSSYHHWHRD